MSKGSAARTIFLLGAGASIDAGVPAVKEMTSEFVELIDKENGDLKGILSEINTKLQQFEPNKTPDIESLLYVLDEIINFERNEISSFANLTKPIKTESLQKLKSALQAFIRGKSLTPTIESVNYLGPLFDRRWGDPVKIFSINYDTCIEMLGRKFKKRIVDGFIPDWNIAELRKNDPDTVALFKLHGSVLWYGSKDGRTVKIPISGPSQVVQESTLKLFSGEDIAPVLLYPAYKRPLETPMIDLAFLFMEELRKSDFLIVIGYSFRDDYLNRLIRDAFHSNSKLHLVLIDPDGKKNIDKIVENSGASYRGAFEDRITFYPFPVKGFLSDFANEKIASLESAIPAFRECSENRELGKTSHWHSLLDPLTTASDPSLFFKAFGWSDVNHVPVQQKLKMVFENFAFAVVSCDTKLVEDGKRHVNDLLGDIWKSIRFQCIKLPPSISASLVLRRGIEVLPTSEFFNNELKSIYLKLKQYVSIDSRIEALNNHWKRIIGIRKFFEAIGSGAAVPADVFISKLKVEFPEKVNEIAAWYDKGLGDQEVASNKLHEILSESYPESFKVF